MALRPSARHVVWESFGACVERNERNGPGRGWMSTSSVALAVGRRRKIRKSVSHSLLGGAAAACLVVGCSWTVYTNIIASSVFPTLGDGYDEPVVVARPKPMRSTARAISETFAALSELAPVLPAVTDAPSITPNMFNERFAASAAQAVESRAAEAPTAPGLDAPKVAEAVRGTAAPKLVPASKKDAAPAQVALNTRAQPSPRIAETQPETPKGYSFGDMAQRAKAAVMSIASGQRSSITEKLWGKEQAPRGPLLSYASADASVTGSIPRDQNPKLGGSPPYDRDTAVYDISAHMVYLPDGTSLEAHSGLGSKLDDPKSASIRMHGVTPPHIYDLSPREALFHGVAALRLNPIGGEDAIHGRSGLLAHSYMLGPNGDSNGCVSFKDYSAFLSAYRNQGIRKLAVVTRIE
jgi:hypothetical protein